MEYFKIVALLTIVFIFSCKKGAEITPDENELITTIKLSITDGATTQFFVWQDIDGTGGKAPIIDKILLKPATTYTITVDFLDESKMPSINLTTEIAAESNEHLILFTSYPSTLLKYQYLDKDSRNLPIGLIGNVATQNIGVGTLKIQLRHQPPVNGTPAKDGTPTPGSDDASVEFPLEIK